MNGWNDGYFTDSAYTYGYYRELSPNFMRWCLTLEGFAAPENSEDACHCELGFGQGISANIHAAATPGKYFGTDFNPAHAANAQELSAASGAEAKFFEDSFEEFAKRDDLPQFDTIGFHGIWSWISDENRRHMLDIVRKHLKSGGVVYCSYNCLPGWSPAAPLRELLRLHDIYHTGGGTTADRVKSALSFVEEMIAAKPGYLNIAPNFTTVFDGIKKHSPDYIAHEYLNLDWDLMYFTDVAEMFREHKLDFAMNAVPIESIETGGFPPAVKTFMNKIGNPIMREQVRDYFINRQFRKDLFVRGLRRLSNVEINEKILSTRYLLTRPAADVPMKISTSIGSANLSEEIYRPLLEFFQENNFRPKAFTEYIRRAPKVAVKDFINATMFLVNENYLIPCQSEAAVKRVKKSCERLNAYICERAYVDDKLNFLASPVTGMGVPVNRFQQIMLKHYRDGTHTADGLAKAVWEILSRQGQRVIFNGKQLETPEENLNHLKNMAQSFLVKELPIFNAFQL